jgi:hypothetical protein
LEGKPTKGFGRARGTLPRNWCNIYQLLAFLRRCLLNFYSKAMEQVSLLTDATNLPTPTFLARSSTLDRLHLCEGLTLGISGFVVMTQDRGIETTDPGFRETGVLEKTLTQERGICPSEDGLIPKGTLKETRRERRRSSECRTFHRALSNNTEVDRSD